MLRAFTLILFALALALTCAAQSNQRPIRIAFLDFGNGALGSRVADDLAQSIASNQKPGADRYQVIDQGWARAAALGSGYRGSLNLTLPEARDLGSAIGCDFFFTGEAKTVMRSEAEGSPYSESYAAVYLVSARSGKLALWEWRSAKGSTPQEAEKNLLRELTAGDTTYRYRIQIRRSLEDEQAYRAAALENKTPVIEVMSDDDGATSDGLQAPRPYRRLKPTYPDVAARDEVEATVDVLVDIDAQGEVTRVEVTRWAGYGLDESVVDTVRQLHFFPAHRDGVAIPLRVLLRYNFRKPSKPTRSQ